MLRLLSKAQPAGDECTLPPTAAGPLLPWPCLPLCPLLSLYPPHAKLLAKWAAVGMGGGERLLAGGKGWVLSPFLFTLLSAFVLLTQTTAFWRAGRTRK